LQIFFYEVLSSVTAAEITEDSSLLATGFSDSGIKVWSLVPQKLKLMKTGEQLQDINREEVAYKIKLKFYFLDLYSEIYAYHEKFCRGRTG